MLWARGFVQGPPWEEWAALPPGPPGALRTVLAPTHLQPNQKLPRGPVRKASGPQPRPAGLPRAGWGLSSGLCMSFLLPGVSPQASGQPALPPFWVSWVHGGAAGAVGGQGQLSAGVLTPSLLRRSPCSWPSASRPGQVNLMPMCTSVVSCSDVW